jgi:hypothetical protein
MDIVIVFEGWPNPSVMGIFGPFDNEDSARDWAESNFPRHHWELSEIQPAN